MDNIKKLKLNSSFSLVNQILLIVSGLILPRFILNFYGSEINGLQSSIGQFLSIINFLELGVGSVVQSALYQPLVRGDIDRVSSIASAANHFFKRLAGILLIYVVILCFTFPFFIDSPLSNISTIFLIIAMSISLFSQFYFGLVNQIILNADQKNYIQILGSMATIILNLILSVILIYTGFGIVTVKFVSGLVFLIRPLYLYFYVKRNYNISTSSHFTKDAIPQKWNGIAQHVAYVILDSTDIVVLTIFSTLKNVSVYTIYNLVINGIKLLLSSFTSSFQSFFGHMIAEERISELNLHFNRIEWLMHNASTLLFSLTASLIVPFVKVYTSGINDADYNAPIFALMLCLAQLVYCIRIPYTAVVLSAGHYKQTQASAIIEALLNVVLSIILVSNFGLIGVAVGTFLAVLYRTLYFIQYLSNNILHRSKKIFTKHMLVDILIFSITFWIGSFFDGDIVNIIEWVKLAIVEGIIFSLVVLIVNLVFNREMVLAYLNRIWK
ncbi:polysaccharide biosynthesis C-terminal domain-containing protein [Aerococcus sp. UMB1112A]|uniref:lipopolysaccharide biosynthesis protein n=1 Tax=unclassified Aerococcus TaxID=2618060 RepID=UPI0009120AC9|nr:MULTISPECIES: polysaccharide biosynthesis C-terminal domain-containing protein [unclassified Aerococcus]KAB0645238.1 polysaccharide biosynthesis protein [Aerococcus sanguinicola]MDK6856392.1 polysaccharide biosynthesis C-terminal domain-containing protein [Aerococcus sp. UMB7533]MDK8503297.1 polysaccharide biosynthesis C-terminal domain-containing protein [Aerococcus sp. UMB1112A]OHO42774.1 hypothetical protein HMPREF2705_02610 [Aerococcus sp. HMSC035B07]